MSVIEREHAMQLRQRGYSLSEIAHKLSVSKSSVSVWVRDVPLDTFAKKRITSRSIKGRKKAVDIKRSKRLFAKKLTDQKVSFDLLKIPYTKEFCRLACALLFWCEGEKRSSAIRFTNSDPVLVKTFLTLFRKGFIVDEKKFRVCIHLHDYHDQDSQILYWSKISGIPKGQFFKPYRKRNTGIRKRAGYQGCVSVRYHDYKIVMELDAFWQQFGDSYGRVV